MYMEETRNPNHAPDYFLKKATEFFSNYGLPPFTKPEEALEFVQVADAMADALIARMREENLSYTDETILLFGSPVGEAFRRLLSGTWEFSPKQNRWVIVATTDKGERAEFNVFNKYEKRLAHGSEDSLYFYLQGAAKALTAQ